MAKRALSIARVGGFAAATLLLLLGHRGAAQVFPASDAPAGYLVFPKVVVDVNSTPALDTVIQLTNTSAVDARFAHCFYVDAATWQEVNFTVPLTINQPTGWRVSEGISGVVPPMGDTFVGELKCVEVNDPLSPTPINANDLKGEATIYAVAGGAGGSVDVRSYNAIGFQTLVTDAATQSRQCLAGSNVGGNCTTDAQCPNSTCGVVMCLGDTAGSAECGSAEYVGCPNTLVLDNFFDGAADPVTGNTITTDLTLVPCSQDLTLTGPEAQPITTAQFLIFNEFEQRFSTSARVQCFKETQLSNIDARAGQEASSIFNVNVQGTLTGQTRIRPVHTSDVTTGHGLLAVAEEFHGSGSVAVNVDQVGTNAGKGDFVRFSVTTQ
ncbi:MAG: EB domain-containing protein [Candidatus Binatia bacterium]